MVAGKRCFCPVVHRLSSSRTHLVLDRCRIGEPSESSHGHQRAHQEPAGRQTECQHSGQAAQQGQGRGTASRPANLTTTVNLCSCSADLVPVAGVAQGELERVRVPVLGDGAVLAEARAGRRRAGAKVRRVGRLPSVRQAVNQLIPLFSLAAS